MFFYYPYLCSMKEYRLTDWLPTTKKEVELRGWNELDVILFSADAYVDHPSFGAAVIGRILEAEGLKIAIVPQPNWRDDLRDFKKLGPKFGKQMKAVAAAVAGMSQEAIAELEKNGSYTFVLNGTEAVIETADVEIFSEDIPGWLVANEGNLTVALEVTVTEELRREGVARELVNRIQNIRKSSGFEITDKIKITLSKNPQTDDAVNEYKDYICNQVLGTSLTLTDNVENGAELNFDDFSLYVSVVKE